ncbi:hypothetical protein AVEN_170291-1, partial [Araneus ventricosus]
MTTGNCLSLTQQASGLQALVGSLLAVGSVPLAELALGSRIVHSPHPFLPMSSLTKTGGEDPV